ncbi:MAG: hypothetical protein HUK06_01680 [Bacteroidaceae bacterium]|nr:hypothetical protein [Bacteroidaceae bacterium]
MEAQGNNGCCEGGQTVYLNFFPKAYMIGICGTINTRGGVCRTLRAQYYKNGIANLFRDDGMACTAVMIIEDEQTVSV